MRAKRASEFRAVEASVASETAQRNEYIQNLGGNFLPKNLHKGTTNGNALMLKSEVLI